VAGAAIALASDGAAGKPRNWHSRVQTLPCRRRCYASRLARRCRAETNARLGVPRFGRVSGKEAGDLDQIGCGQFRVVHAEMVVAQLLPHEREQLSFSVEENTDDWFIATCKCGDHKLRLAVEDNQLT